MVAFRFSEKRGKDSDSSAFPQKGKRIFRQKDKKKGLSSKFFSFFAVFFPEKVCMCSFFTYLCKGLLI